MLLNMNTPCSSFVFSYTGEYTDNRVNGSGTIRLLTDGILTIHACSVPFVAYLLGGGGGAAGIFASFAEAGSAQPYYCCGGGGGGKMLISMMPEPGQYNIVIGKGGNRIFAQYKTAIVSAEDGGSTTAFGYTCTGGMGGQAGNTGESIRPTLGGSPDGESPTGNDGSIANAPCTGGAPNGGSSRKEHPSYYISHGGNGYVELIFV